MPQYKKESPSIQSPVVVRSVPAGYQGYMEVNGVRKEIYSKEIKSETYNFRSVSNIKVLPVKINGVVFDAMIDTGASVVSVPQDVIQKLNIQNFTHKKIHSTAGGDVWAYYFPCIITLGSFEISNIECSYNQESPNDFILLGGTFLKNFNYSIDESEQTITFILR